MDPILYSLPLLLSVTLVFTYAVLRTFTQLWIIHRRKVAIFQKYEQDPKSFDSSQSVIEQILEQERLNQAIVRQDYAITGTCLAALGLSGVFLGRFLGYGEFAVGLYIGGIACIVLGVAIALLGYLIRALTRPIHTRQT